jgi:hypothetical protein
MAESAWRKAIEAAAKAAMERRIKPDFQVVRDGHWIVDHDKEIAGAAIPAFLASARESGADIPKIEGEPTC